MTDHFHTHDGDTDPGPGSDATRPCRSSSCEHGPASHQPHGGPRHSDGPTTEEGSRWAVTRRGVVVGAAGLAVGLAGCIGGGDGDGAAPEPITLDQDDSCELCGMVIPNHPGPAAQIFYADQQPSGHDNPARFCSIWEAFQYDFERLDRGWEREAFYVTDYSGVDYEIIEDGGDLLLSSHPAAEHFVDATETTMVVGSDVKGAMGRDLVPFTAEDDATAFQEEYGGDVMGFDEVSPSVISELARG